MPTPATGITFPIGVPVSLLIGELVDPIRILVMGFSGISVQRDPSIGIIVAIINCGTQRRIAISVPMGGESGRHDSPTSHGARGMEGTRSSAV